MNQLTHNGEIEVEASDEAITFSCEFAEHSLFLVKNSYQFLPVSRFFVRNVMSLGLVTLLPLCLSRLLSLLTELR